MNADLLNYAAIVAQARELLADEALGLETMAVAIMAVVENLAEDLGSNTEWWLNEAEGWYEEHGAQREGANGADTIHPDETSC